MMKKSNSILILNKLIEAQNDGCCVNIDMMSSIKASIYMPYINVNTYGNNVVISSKAGSVEFDVSRAYEKDGVIITDNDIIIDIIQ